jgi:hypothetical protein
MEPHEVLRRVTDLAKQGRLSRRDLLDAYHGGAGVSPLHAFLRRLDLPTTLASLGGAVIAVGITVLVVQRWEDLGGAARILVTLGPGVAAGWAGHLLGRAPNRQVPAWIGYLLSAILVTTGLFVTFDVAGRDLESPGTHSTVFAISLAVYLLAYLLERDDLLLGITAVLATCLYFGFTAFLAQGVVPVDQERFTNGRVLAAGAAYLLAGYAFARRGKAFFRELFYVAGVVGFLGGALALGGGMQEPILAWVILFPVLVFGIIALGIRLGARSLLLLGSLFLMIFIIKTTLQYFRDDLGWPLALVLSGVALIAVGYGTFRLNRRVDAGRRRGAAEGGGGDRGSPENEGERPSG